MFVGVVPLTTGGLADVVTTTIVTSTVTDMFPALSAEVSNMTLLPTAMAVNVTLHVVAVGYTTVPTVAVEHVTLTAAPVSIVPVIVWLSKLVGLVTGSRVTAAGVLS